MPTNTLEDQRQDLKLKLNEETVQEEQLLKMESPDNLEPLALLNFEQKRLDELLKKQQALKDHYVIVRKSNKNIPMFIEACRLQGGQSFGE